MIVAGEASGDLHGSGVIKALRLLDPEIQVCGMGGEHMRRAGAELIIDSSRLAVVGITEVLGRLGSLLQAYRNLRKVIQGGDVSLLILIDFPDFNLFLSQVAQRKGIPILYYISPQVWAWRSGRLKKIARRINKMAVIFPFEVPLYQKAGVDVEFVGHPLLDILGTHPLNPLREEMRGKPRIAILPGSREKEVRALLPEMLKAAEILFQQKPEAQFFLAAAPTVRVQEMKEFFTSSKVPMVIVEGQTYETIMAADTVIVASGTATLETAILGKPMVVVYQVSPFSYWFGRRLVKVKWVGLVNIIAGKAVVPELLQEEARAGKIAAAVLRIINDEPYRKQMVKELEEIKSKLGTPGAADRVARLALELIPGYSCKN